VLCAINSLSGYTNRDLFTIDHTCAVALVLDTLLKVVKGIMIGGFKTISVIA